MDDLRERFATLNRVPVPDVWPDIERRVGLLDAPVPTDRLIGRRPELTLLRPERGGRATTATRSRRMSALLVAAILALAAVVGGLAAGSALVRLRSVAPATPDASASTSSTPATSAPSVEPSPSSSAPPSAPPPSAASAPFSAFGSFRSGRLVSA